DAATVSSSAGNIQISASSTGQLETLTVGGAGAGTFALGGAVSLNKTHDTVEARITNGASATAAGQISLSATDNPEIDCLAGGVAGAGGAAIGAALATNDLGGTVRAYTDASTLSSTGGNVQIVATAMPTIKALTVGGAGAGAFAAGGAVALNKSG